MARLLGRSASTVSREINRNGGYDRYRAALADEKAWVQALRPKRCKLANNPGLRQAVVRKLRLNWSPEQIAGWLKRTHPEDELYHMSHETIDRSLFVQARGVLRKELLRHQRYSWRGQGGQNETEQPDHSASLGDSITSSTRIRSSVHTRATVLDLDVPNREEPNFSADRQPSGRKGDSLRCVGRHARLQRTFDAVKRRDHGAGR